MQLRQNFCLQHIAVPWSWDPPHQADTVGAPRCRGGCGHTRRVCRSSLGSRTAGACGSPTCIGFPLPSRGIAGEGDHRSISDCVDQDQDPEGDRACQPVRYEHNTLQGEHEAEGLALIAKRGQPELVDAEAAEIPAAKHDYDHCEGEGVVAGPGRLDFPVRECTTKPRDEPSDQGADRGSVGVTKCNLELGHDVRGGGTIGDDAAGPALLAHGRT